MSQNHSAEFKTAMGAVAGAFEHVHQMVKTSIATGTAAGLAKAKSLGVSDEHAEEIVQASLQDVQTGEDVWVNEFHPAFHAIAHGTP